MTISTKLIVVLTAVTTAAAAIALATPSTASGSKTLHRGSEFHFWYRTSRYQPTYVDEGKPGTGIGDERFDRARVRRLEKDVGVIENSCVVMRPGNRGRLFCQTQVTMFGQGKLYLEETYPTKKHRGSKIHVAVIGGAGYYRGATGYGSVTFHPRGDYFNLSWYIPKRA
ncbi:MAG: hypothetical protein ABR579_02170 [Actinomycetota bacterium]